MYIEQPTPESIAESIEQTALWYEEWTLWFTIIGGTISLGIIPLWKWISNIDKRTIELESANTGLAESVKEIKEIVKKNGEAIAALKQDVTDKRNEVVLSATKQLADIKERVVKLETKIFNGKK